MTDFRPRYYALDPAKPGDLDTYFRLSSGGRYDRWDGATKAWVHVASSAAREYLSRAIENGDAWPTKAGNIR
jgi:hypothetical protein